MAEYRRYKRIVVPLDGSGWSRRAVPHAVDLARSNGAELILLHVYHPPAHEYVDQIALAGQETQLDEMLEQMKQDLIGLRTELREEGINVRTQMIEGRGTSNIICEYVNNENVDLVIMATHGRKGLRKLIFGSTADEIVNGVHVPVLLVNPDKEEHETSDTDG
ncbi:MAG: universal stress protein [Burkholderiales bacterium]|nr:universal stress protein [Anaerolineae bacterium]